MGKLGDLVVKEGGAHRSSAFGAAAHQIRVSADDLPRIHPTEAPA